MQFVERGCGVSRAFGRYEGIVFSMDQEQRKIFGVGKSGFDLLVALSGSHLRDHGSETMWPQGGIVKRAGSSIAEAGDVNAIAIDVVAFEDVVEDRVETVGDFGCPPEGGGLGIEHEVIGLRDEVVGGIHGVDGISRASA